MGQCALQPLSPPGDGRGTVYVCPTSQASETTSSRILQTSSHPVSLVSRLPAGVPLTAGPFLPRLDVGLRPSRSSRRVQHVDGLTAFALATPGPS